MVDKVEPREPVVWFAGEMEKKLRLNEHKGGWEFASQWILLNMLHDEVTELGEALLSGNPLRIISEAADCGNFSMMLADYGKRLEERKDG